MIPTLIEDVGAAGVEAGFAVMVKETIYRLNTALDQSLEEPSADNRRTLDADLTGDGCDSVTWNFGRDIKIFWPLDNG